MRCEGCEVEAERDAKGWEAHLADLDDDGQDEVAFYGPVCAGDIRVTEPDKDLNVVS